MIKFINNIKDFFYKKDNGLYFNGLQPLSNYLDVQTKEQVLIAYLQTPTLSALINKFSTIFSTGNFTFKGQANIFSHPLYSKNEFLRTYAKQMKLFNECFIYINNSIINTYSDKTTFLILPAQDVITVLKEPGFDIKKIKNIKDVISHYELYVNGKNIPFKQHEILHITNSSLKFDNESVVTPNLTLTAAEQPINTIRSAYEMRVGLNYRKGGTNILTNRTISDGRSNPLNPKDVARLQKDFAKYSLNKADYQTIITNAAVENINLNYPIKDLEINEGIKQAKLDLCDVLEMPIEVLNTHDSTTFANKEIAEKQLYTSTIIPEWKILVSELNNYFLNSYFDVDYSDILILQSDRKKQIETNNLETQVIIQLNTEITKGNIRRNAALDILTEIYKYETGKAEKLIIK